MADEAVAEPEQKPKKVKEPKPPDPMRVLARRAVEIAEGTGAKLGSAITAPQARQVKQLLGDQPVERFKPATLAQLQDYAQGGRGVGRDSLPEESREAIRTFCRESGTRRIWPRKVAALVLALDEQQKGASDGPG